MTISRVLAALSLLAATATAACGTDDPDPTSADPTNADPTSETTRHDPSDDAPAFPEGTATPTAFDGLKISGNRLRAVDRTGISLWSNWCRTPDLAPDWKPVCTEAWKPAKNVVLSGNMLTDIGGDGMRLATTDAAKVTGNLPACAAS